MNCDFCGGDFIQKRDDQRFCSTSCRMRWHKNQQGVGGIIMRRDEMIKYVKLTIKIPHDQASGTLKPGKTIIVRCKSELSE